MYFTHDEEMEGRLDDFIDNLKTQPEGNVNFIDNPDFYISIMQTKEGKKELNKIV
jgi:hypothetical protein